MEHELLFPLKQQYGPAAVDLVLIKKQELDHSANDLRPRTVSPFSVCGSRALSSLKLLLTLMRSVGRDLSSGALVEWP